MNRSMRLGVIGCGEVTESWHLPALQRVRDAEVAAVADIDPNRLAHVADRFHIQQRYTNFRALLEAPEIEAVAVCVPAAFHVEVALAALDAEKHLFIEKPLALSLDDSDRLIERAKRSSRKVMVGFNLRWHRLVRRARTVLRRGALGPLESVRTILSSGRCGEGLAEWRKRRAQGGGVLLEVAVHHFDLWRFLLEADVEEVFASSRSEQSDDETAVVAARMAGGLLAVSLFSWRGEDANELEIHGRAGRLRVSCYRFDGFDWLATSRGSGGARARLVGLARTLTEVPRAALEARHGGVFADSYRAQWQHFIESVQRDAPVGCTLEDGRRALEVALAAAESAALGRPSSVRHAPRTVALIAPAAHRPS